MLAFSISLLLPAQTLTNSQVRFLVNPSPGEFCKSVTDRENKLSRYSATTYLIFEGLPRTPRIDPRSVEQLRSRTEANRENAQKSTGPRTIEGKSRAAANSFKHGLYSQATVINGETMEDFEDLRNDFLAHYRPEDPVERTLVEELVQNRWRILRFRRHEATVFSQIDTPYPDLKLLATIQRMLTSAERAFHKALTQLEGIRKRKPAPPTPQIEPEIDRKSQKDLEFGFVPQNEETREHDTPEIAIDTDMQPWVRSEIPLKLLP